MGLMIDLSIIALLIIAIIYAIVLNYRLGGVKEGKAQMDQTIHTFNQTIQSAQTTLLQLQKSTNNIAEQLQDQITKASALRDDLVIILEKSAQEKKKAVHSQTFFSYAPKTSKVSGFTFSKPKDAPVNLYQSEAEKELYQALQRLKGEQ